MTSSTNNDNNHNNSKTTPAKEQFTAPEDVLVELRQKIDHVDGEILQLISNRAKLAQEVAVFKKEHADEVDSNPIFYRPEREAQVLKNIMKRNQASDSPISDEKMARLFREIMSVCLDLEAPQKIAFLGPVGTFTHAAA